MRLALLIVMAGMIMAGCGDGKKHAPGAFEETVGMHMDEDAEMDYRQEVRHFKLEGFSKTGENQWAVTGQFADIVDPDVILRSIEGISTSDKVSVQLRADSGVYNKDTRSAELNGNVVVTLSDGGKVYMEYARWNAAEEEISTDTAIRIEHSGITLTGTGAVVKPQSEWAEVKKDIELGDTKGRIITCDGPLEVDYKQRKAILKNNVFIVDPQGSIAADTVIAYFDTEKRSIERIEWEGNVEAVY